MDGDGRRDSEQTSVWQVSSPDEKVVSRSADYPICVRHSRETGGGEVRAVFGGQEVTTALAGNRRGGEARRGGLANSGSAS